MSYDSTERGNIVPVTVTFYQFQRGSQMWRYTGADRDLIMNDQQWSSTAITDSGKTFSGNSVVDTLEITAPSTLEAAQQFRGNTPADSVFLTIFQTHATSLFPVIVLDADVACVWIGTVSDVGQADPDRITISGATLTSAFDRDGLRLTWGRNCNHTVYDHLCTMNPANFITTVNVEAITGNSVTAAAFAAHPDGYFDGGYIEWEIADGVFDRLAIDRHVGTGLTLLGTTSDMNVGQAVNAYPGCSQTADICVSKFNNILNYGGANAMPGNSPFNGNPVF